MVIFNKTLKKIEKALTRMFWAMTRIQMKTENDILKVLFQVTNFDIQYPYNFATKIKLSTSSLSFRGHAS